MVVTKEQIDFYKNEGYYALCYKPDRGLCGLKKFMFTIALVYGISEIGYVGRYCYPITEHEAITISQVAIILTAWDGKEDPKGNWIKHKGEIEYRNPSYEKELV